MGTTELVERTGEQQDLDPYSVERMSILRNYVPAICSRLALSSRTRELEHSLGEQITMEERMQIAGEAMLEHKLGERGIYIEDKNARLTRYRKITFHICNRDVESVHELVDTALAIFDPDKAQGDAFLKERYPEQYRRSVIVDTSYFPKIADVR